jgi:hypothetical protein
MVLHVVDLAVKTVNKGDRIVPKLDACKVLVVKNPDSMPSSRSGEY